MAVLRNGKLVDGNYHSGREILRETPKGRRPVEIKGRVVKNLDPRKNYSPEEINRKVRTMPDRCKGTAFFSPRSARSRELIHQQIVSVSQHLFRKHSDVDFDDENYDWLVIMSYSMPPNWSVRQTPLMIIFPTQYPTVPPIGFYLPDTLRSPNGHLFGRTYDGATKAPIKKGWKWYCAYIKPGSWKPDSRNWQRGDNLWDYLTLVGEVLAGGDS